LTLKKKQKENGWRLKLTKETDPNGKTAKEPGSKLDSGKACAFRGLVDYFPRALDAVATVSTFGASKYTWGGWKTVPEGYERYSDALMRHWLEECKGEPVDKDSNLTHQAHIAWNALARLELLLKKKTY
jgi:hypothetical protein